MITEVFENSTGAKTGLNAGDVITQVDGKNVTGILRFQRAVSAIETGDMALSVVRDRSQITVNVTPEKGKVSRLVLEEKDPE